ncbi:MAG: RsmB/NOP family class I SAM-dependent RNA methyltransferase [Alphaproteobacteria bacterium]
MTPGARAAAAIEILTEIAAARAPADVVLSGWTRRSRFAGGGDRAAIAGIVYGVLRRWRQLDWHLGAAAEAARPRVLAHLVLAAGWSVAEVEAGFDGGPHRPEPLTPAERTLLAAQAGWALDDPGQPAPVAGNYPDWMEGGLARVFGPDRAAEMAALREEAPTDLRVNTAKASREAARAALAEAGIAADPTPWSPMGLRLAARRPLAATAPWREGWIEPQDEASQLAALLVDARPGMAVLDYCAGGGGKTLALAAAMHGQGRLVACDRSQARLERARPRLARAGVWNAECRVLPEERGLLPEAGFDRVLVDAPCSGTGAVRRNPETMERLRAADILRLTAEQDAILADAARLVAPGGRLVYATCSLLPEEDGDRIDAFLAARPDFRPLPVAAVWPHTVGGAVPSDIGARMLLTPRRHGTDGFFLAILERVA